jgi:hypothetical protein
MPGTSNLSEPMTTIIEDRNLGRISRTGESVENKLLWRLMKQILLNHGEIVLVDDEDFEELSKYTWTNDGKGYAVRSDKDSKRKSKIRMHRQVMGFPDGFLIDHIDGNPLNNQKENLRIVTMSGNGCNRHLKSKDKSSKYFGVHHNKASGSWVAVLAFEGKSYYLGAYRTEVEAAVAYNLKAKELGFLTQNEVDMSTPLQKLKRGSNRITYPGLISPDGTIYRNIERMVDFCKEHGLSDSSVNVYYKQKKTSYKGWTILYA